MIIRSISTNIAAWQRKKATDIRRVLADVEANAKLLREHQSVVEIQLLAVPAASFLMPSPKRVTC
jgi:hypothetical protein